MAMPAWVAEAGVAAQVVIAAMAVWGERIRAALLKPDLRLMLLHRLGEATRQDLYQTHSGQTRIVGSIPARYYHLRLTNRNRTVAHEVRVFVTQLDLRGADGRPQIL